MTHSPSSPATEGLRAALETIAGWRNVNLTGYEYGHELRDIIRSITDCAAAALEANPAPFYGAQCPSYPDCNGGCGLGCTHEIEQSRRARPSAGSATVMSDCGDETCGCTVGLPCPKPAAALCSSPDMGDDSND